ncbi:sensor domain-containing diguanylate cyclase [Ferdinandcohnia quinoae]|uniref:Sensor domain-containing diguanylate cyclase n=1 Tax=Fredinandcohnia quinoae TaxID=2918902 RepID=A0AAW5EA90_9BACI|nr:sensor domain-containing diguanylate cyclase [Fredinandcohnia sp. SECRCQ15]MCH1626590.1 sensor domain-containing diguanylate cyclase [Fredinandcohnia sp. SECRCQ15]
MEVSKLGKNMLWIVWLFVFPISMWLIYKYSNPIIMGYEWDIVSFVVLTGFISILPIVVNDTTILFTEGVSLAVFLFFGLFVEIVLSFIAIIILLIKVRIGMKDSFRLPLNSLLFLGTSVAAAFVYYLLGGEHGVIDMSSPLFILPLVGYQITRFIVNHSLLRLYRQYLQGRKLPIITKDLLWEGMTTLLHFPVGLVLYMLYVEVGLAALLYVGIPLISLSFMLRLYYSSQRINFYLQKATELGHQLAGRQKVAEVLDLFIEKISEMLPVDYAYILDLVAEDEQLQVIRYFSKEGNEDKVLPMKRGEGIAGKVWESSRAVLFHTKKEYKSITMGFMPVSVESVICVPVLRNQQVVGVFALASNKRRCYEKYQVMIVDILASYLAVAIENARHHEEAKNKSERCSLTNLYNYRYFEQVLEAEYQQLQDNKTGPLSLILLDIDHFKTINDTYGHQSGNDILCELANRLQNIIGELGIVARYGGEEFVILLPNIDKYSCRGLAETIRQMIANRPFSVQDDLLYSGEEIMVRITASIGFATAPYDAESSLDLVRHADRAMYTGAKQAGRNRVAEYVK